MNIQYQLIPLTKENITKLEQLRYNAYNFNEQDFPIPNNFHYQKLLQNKYLVFGCFLNNQLVGACYISNSCNSLYIEQLFITKSYQRTRLHLGKNLLLHILNNNHLIEQHYQTTFSYSRLDNTKNTKDFYQSLGYKEKNYHLIKHL